MLLDALRHALEDLARPAPEQLRRLDVRKAHIDELALSLDDVLAGCLERYKFPARIESSLREIDSILLSMSGPENAENWTPHALRTDPRWESVRVKAQHALAASGWPGAAS